MLYKFIWMLRALFYKLFFKKIGLFTYIAKPIFLLGTRNISIGNKVRIFPGIRMEAHNGSEIIIEEDVAIGQNFHITSSKENLVISKGTTISGNVFITNIDHDYQEIDVHIMKQKFIVKETKIGENCFIGYGAAIQAGTSLGKQCIVGTNSVVRGKFPNYSVIVGSPAKIVKRYNFKTEQWEKTNEVGEFLNVK